MERPRIHWEAQLRHFACRSHIFAASRLTARLYTSISRRSMKSISILLLLLLIAGYADGQDGPVCASTGGVSVDLLVEVLSDEVPYRDKSLLEYPDIRAMIESLNATNGTASLHACWDMARNIGMTAICDDESQDCASLAEYNGQPCESSSLCQGSPDGESFQANC